jgi:hypothetical protein
MVPFMQPGPGKRSPPCGGASGERGDRHRQGPATCNSLSAGWPLGPKMHTLDLALTLPVVLRDTAVVYLYGLESICQQRSQRVCHVNAVLEGKQPVDEDRCA